MTIPSAGPRPARRTPRHRGRFMRPSSTAPSAAGRRRASDRCLPPSTRTSVAASRPSAIRRIFARLPIPVEQDRPIQNPRRRADDMPASSASAGDGYSHIDPRHLHRDRPLAHRLRRLLERVPLLGREVSRPRACSRGRRSRSSRPPSPESSSRWATRPPSRSGGAARAHAPPVSKTSCVIAYAPAAAIWRSTLLDQRSCPDLRLEKHLPIRSEPRSSARPRRRAYSPDAGVHLRGLTTGRSGGTGARLHPRPATGSGY